jgi:hypothetical protein
LELGTSYLELYRADSPGKDWQHPRDASINFEQLIVGKVVRRGKWVVARGRFLSRGADFPILLKAFPPGCRNAFYPIPSEYGKP